MRMAAGGAGPAVPDVADKADALAGKRPHQTLRRTVVAERAAHRVDPRRQRRFGDDAPAPHLLQQIVLADDPVAVPHEIAKQIEGFGFEIYNLAAAAQFAAFDIEPITAKRQQHDRSPGEDLPVSSIVRNKVRFSEVS